MASAWMFPDIFWSLKIIKTYFCMIITKNRKVIQTKQTYLLLKKQTHLQLMTYTLNHQDQRNLDAQDPVSPSSHFNNSFGMTQDQLAGRSGALPLSASGNTHTVPLIQGTQTNSPNDNAEANSPKEDTALDRILNTAEKPFEKYSFLEPPFVYHKALEGVLESGVLFFLSRPSLLIGLVSLCKALYDFQTRKLYTKCTAQKMTP